MQIIGEQIQKSPDPKIGAISGLTRFNSGGESRIRTNELKENRFTVYLTMLTVNDLRSRRCKDHS